MLVELGVVEQRYQAVLEVLEVARRYRADGGAAYVTLDWQGVTVRHDMDFGRPPDLFADLYGLAMAMLNSPETCEPDNLVTVAGDYEPWEAS